MHYTKILVKSCLFLGSFLTINCQQPQSWEKGQLSIQESYLLAVAHNKRPHNIDFDCEVDEHSSRDLSTPKSGVQIRHVSELAIVAAPPNDPPINKIIRACRDFLISLQYTPVGKQVRRCLKKPRHED